MATYFISDLHLSEAAPSVFAAFCQFMETTAKGADAVYILGDFFNAWIGDDDCSGASQIVKAKIKHFTDSGLPIFFMVGNRDFLVGEQFAAETGVNLIQDPTIIDLDGENVLLMHGDSLCIDDTEYMQFRAQVRNPDWQKQAMSMPIEQRRAVAAQMREQSKSMNSNKAEDIMDVNENAVLNKLVEKDVFVLIHGHTHRPAVHEVQLPGKTAKRFVLGDWGQQGWYIKAENGQIDLINFNI